MSGNVEEWGDFNSDILLNNSDIKDATDSIPLHNDSTLSIFITEKDTSRSTASKVVICPTFVPTTTKQKLHKSSNLKEMGNESPLKKIVTENSLVTLIQKIWTLVAQEINNDKVITKEEFKRIRDWIKEEKNQNPSQKNMEEVSHDTFDLELLSFKQFFTGIQYFINGNECCSGEAGNDVISMLEQLGMFLYKEYRQRQDSVYSNAVLVEQAYVIGVNSSNNSNPSNSRVTGLPDKVGACQGVLMGCSDQLSSHPELIHSIHERIPNIKTKKKQILGSLPFPELRKQPNNIICKGPTHEAKLAQELCLSSKLKLRRNWNVKAAETAYLVLNDSKSKLLRDFYTDKRKITVLKSGNEYCNNRQEKLEELCISTKSPKYRRNSESEPTAEYTADFDKQDVLSPVEQGGEVACPKLYCKECRLLEATLYCLMCISIFCKSCWKKKHGKEANITMDIPYISCATSMKAFPKANSKSSMGPPLPLFSGGKSVNSTTPCIRKDDKKINTSFLQKNERKSNTKVENTKVDLPIQGSSKFFLAYNNRDEYIVDESAKESWADTYQQEAYKKYVESLQHTRKFKDPACRSPLNPNLVNLDIELSESRN